MMSAVVKRFSLCCLLLAGTAQAQTITKCQDEDGKWHYGDFASEACSENSTITEIDERGVKVRETEAPPTKDELDAQEAEKRAEQLEAERRRKVEEGEQRLLRTYDTAQSIINARDEHVEAMDRDLDSYRLFRQDLVDERNRLEENKESEGKINNIEQQIQQYDAAIRELQAERRETVEKFNRDLERYRELTE